MLGKTHKVGGICAGALTSSVLWQTTDFSEYATIGVPVLMVFSIVGSLLPDIDHPNSKLGHRLKPISMMINKVFGHRGATHTLLSLLVVSIGLFMINLSLPLDIQPFGWAGVVGMFVGYLSHLFLDALTPSGIPLLSPFSKRKFRLAKLTTGKYDFLVSTAMIIGTGAYFYLSFPLN